MSAIKDIWLKIWVYLKPILKVKGIISFLTSKTFLVILIVILVLMIGRSCAKIRDAQRMEDINQQNITALTDTIKIERTKSGSLEQSIAGYVLSEKNLKKVNEDLYNRVKDEKGKVISLNRAVIQLWQEMAGLKEHINYLESIMGQPVQINDSTFQIPWLLKYDWDPLNFDVYNGQSFVGLSIKPGYTWREAIADKNVIKLIHYKTEMIDRLSQVDLTFGQKVEDDQLRIFITTKYPGFTTTSLSGVLIDPNTNPYIKDLMKKKKWIPNTWSVGVGPSFGYDVLTLKPYLGIGVTINYNLLQW